MGILTQGQVYELDMASYLEGFGGDLWQQQNNKSTFGVLVLAMGRDRAKMYVMENSHMLNVLQQVEDIMKGLPELSSNAGKHYLGSRMAVCHNTGPP